MDDGGAVESVRREEVVRTRTQRVATGTARLRRVVVRERRTIEVEVAHEEFRLEVVGLEGDGTDQDVVVAVDPGPRTASTVLHEERIEIVRRTVPVERVTLVVDAVAGSASADVAVRREQIEVDPGNPGQR